MRFLLYVAIFAVSWALAIGIGWLIGTGLVWLIRQWEPSALVIAAVAIAMVAGAYSRARDR